MPRTLSRLTGTGTGGNWSTGTPDRATRLVFFQPAKDIFDLLMLGVIGRNRYCGGTDAIPIDASAAATVQLHSIAPFVIDNTGNQFSGFTDANGATLIVQVRFRLRVSDAAINVTPVIYNETTALPATISGAVACSTTTDTYAGANQQQTVTLTLPTGVNVFHPRLTIAGTPAPGLKVWGTAIFDMYINN